MHREFERVLKTYNTESKEFGYENWADNLAKACISMNSLKHSIYKMSAYEILRNRVQNSVEPPEFHPTGFERRIVSERFLNKAENLYKSKLKMGLPVFAKGQKIKVKIPKQNIRYGTVSATRDNASKGSVLVKFPGQKAIGIHKNYICIPKSRNTNVNQDVDVENPNELLEEEAAESVADAYENVNDETEN